MGFFQRRDSELYVEDLPLTEVARRAGTPCYVYSRAAIEHNWNNYEQGFDGHPHQICYAVKANSNLAVLNLLARLGSGFDIVSGGELGRVLRAGGDPRKIVFSGVGKTAAEIERGLEAGVGCFDIESVDELTRVNGIARGLGVAARIALRVNPDVNPDTHPYIATGLKTSKFGVAHEDALDVYRMASDLSNIEITGVAAHIGSQIRTSAPFLEALTRLLVLVDALENEKIRIEHLDIGGGLAVRYHDENPPGAGALVSMFVDVLRQGGRQLTLLVEPGRSIVGDAGVLLTKVEYLKRNGDRWFCVVDAGMNDYLRPALYQARQDIVPVALGEDRVARTYDVVGPVCESADALGQDRELAVSEGDLLAVMQTGAYGFVMSSNYNSRPRAAEVLVDGAHMHLARRRETVDELYAVETLLP